MWATAPDQLFHGVRARLAHFGSRLLGPTRPCAQVATCAILAVLGGDAALALSSRACNANDSGRKGPSRRWNSNKHDANIASDARPGRKLPQGIPSANLTTNHSKFERRMQREFVSSNCLHLHTQSGNYRGLQKERNNARNAARRISPLVLPLPRARTSCRCRPGISVNH